MQSILLLELLLLSESPCHHDSKAPHSTATHATMGDSQEVPRGFQVLVFDSDVFG